MSNTRSQGTNASKTYITAMRDNTKAIRANSNAVKSAVNKISENLKSIKTNATNNIPSSPSNEGESKKIDLDTILKYLKATYYTCRTISVIKKILTPLIKSGLRGTGGDTEDSSTDEEKKKSGVTSAKEKISGIASKTIGFAKDQVVKFAVEGLDKAKELEDVQKNIKRIFSDTSTIDSWSKDLVNKFGLTQLEAKNFVTSIGDVAKLSGVSGKELNIMSSSLVELGADMASAFNISPEDMIGNLSDALNGGDSLESFGVSFEGDEFKDFAKSKGIKGDLGKVSDEEMVNLRYQYIMENTTDYKGAFQKNSKNLNAQMEILEDNMNSIKLDVMKEALPIIEMVMSKINDLASKFREWVSGNLPLIQSIRDKLIVFFEEIFPVVEVVISKLGEVVGVIVNNWSSIEPILKIVIAAMAIYYTITTLVTLAQMALNFVLSANPIGLVIAAIAIFIGILVLAYKKVDWVKELFDALWDTLMTVLSGIGKVAKAIMKLFGLGDGESTFEVNEEKTTTTKDQSLEEPTRSDIDGATKDSYLQSMDSLKPSTAGMADYSAKDYSDGLGQNFGISEFDNPSKLNYQSNSGIGTDPLTMKSNQTNVNVTIEGNIYGEKDLVDRVGKAIADRVSTMIPVVV